MSPLPPKRSKNSQERWGKNNNVLPFSVLTARRSTYCFTVYNVVEASERTMFRDSVNVANGAI